MLVSSGPERSTLQSDIHGPNGVAAVIEKLTKLIKEIHRRSVWQVLGIYLAGSLAAFELSGSLSEAAGLPDWFPTFALALLILGLPIVVATAYVQEAPKQEPEPVEDRPEATRPIGPAPKSGEAVDQGDSAGTRPDAGPTGHRLLTWKTVGLGGLGALALWGGVATVLWLTGAPGSVALPALDRSDRIAVLPVENLTGDEARQFLADGLHDEVITRLQQIGDIRVISRTSTLRYRGTQLDMRQIARELDADVILESTLQSAGAMVRFNAQLIDGDTDEHLWADTFDRTIDPDELLTVQADLALEVAEVLAAQLTTSERDRVTNVGTADPDAQRQYLLGIAYRNSARPGDLGASIEAFERAVTLDPDFALAYSAMGESYMMLAHGPVPPWEAFPPGETAARQALAIEPDMAEALTTLADVAYHYRWAWAEAEERFRRALELNPSHATAHWWLAGLLTTLRLHDEAVEHARTALPMDPRNVTSRWFTARVMYWAGRMDEALAVLDEGLATDPNHPSLLEMKGTILLRAGSSEDERAQGLALLERAAGMGPGQPVFAYGAGLALAGRVDEASAVLERAASATGDAYVPRYYLAWIAAELGDTERALDLLAESAEVREAPLIWLNIDPPFRSLHAEPGFQAILDEMGLTAGDFDERGVPIID